MKCCSRKTWIQQIFAALVLTSILAGGMGFPEISTAATEVTGNSSSPTSSKQSSLRELPESVVNAIRRDLSDRTDISPRRLQVAVYSQQIWTDGCLGLGKPDELCTQIFIEDGWRVVMSHQDQIWVYRTDGEGQIVRLESSSNALSELPRDIAEPVLSDARSRSRPSNSDLHIVAAQRLDWSNSCLGLYQPGVRCIQSNIPGWRVTVSQGERQTWIYRTNSTGTIVRLEREIIR